MRNDLFCFGINGIATRAYMLTAAGEVVELAWEAPGWKSADVPGAPPAGAPALAGFALAGTDPRVYYLNGNREVVELAWTGSSWNVATLVPSAGARAGSPITAFCDNGGVPHVFYLGSDGGVVELKVSESAWIEGARPGGPVPLAGSPLTSFAVGGGDPRVYYFDGNDKVVELAYVNGGWTSISPAVPVASGDSDIACFGVNGTDTRVYYLDQNQVLTEMAWTGNGWTSGRPPTVSAPAPGTALCCFGIDGRDTRVYYFNADHHVVEVAWDGGKWVSIVIPGAPAALAGSPIACFGVENRDTRVYYLDASSQIVEIAWTGAGWTWSRPVAPPPVVRKPTLTARDGSLIDRDGNKVAIRGVNLPLLDNWAFPGSDYLDAVLETGCNAVRIQWYVNYTGGARPPYDVTDLAGVLQRCIAADVIPIVMLGDYTCNGDATLIANLIKWWTSAATVAALKPYANCLILNLANELGYWHWADNPSIAIASYRDSYIAAIKAIRAAGLTMPLMIDATDCGSSLDAFLTVGAQLVAADPAANLLLSVHAYWAGTDGRPFVQPCVTAKLPIICGEIANRQDGDEDGDYYNLDGTQGQDRVTNGFTYQALLATLVQDGIGWLAWSWGPDKCAPRQLSTDGSFANLTPYGKDILSNATYGLKGAVRVKP